MCELCVDIAKKDFACWDAADQRTARLAILSGTQNEYGLTERGNAARYAAGRDTQRGIDDERYQKVINPKVLAIRAAVAQAEEQLTEGRNPAEILRMFLTNVRTDSASIPLALPV